MHETVDRLGHKEVLSLTVLGRERQRPFASSRAKSPHVKPGWHRSRALHCRPGGRQPVQLSREGGTASALDLLRSRQLLTKNWSNSHYGPAVQPCDSTPTCRLLDRKLALDFAGLPAVRCRLLSLISVPDDQRDGRRLLDLGIWPQRWRSWPTDVCLLPDFRGCPDSDRHLVGPIWSGADPKCRDDCRSSGRSAICRLRQFLAAPRRPSADRSWCRRIIDRRLESPRALVSQRTYPTAQRPDDHVGSLGRTDGNFARGISAGLGGLASVV